MTPRVLSELATMQRVADAGCSLSRTGKCELKLALMRNVIAQAADPALAKRLRKILRSDAEHTLVCIPPMFGPMDANKAHYYGEFTRPEVVADLFSATKVYGSTGVSRRDWWRPGMDEAAYWALVRGIWQDRPVLLVAGSGKGRRAREGFLANAGSVDVLDAPQRDAWAAYEGILSDCLAWAAAKQRPLVYAALGATASVLAFDLGKRGVQCLDLGHACQSWAQVDLKAPEHKKDAA